MDGGEHVGGGGGGMPELGTALRCAATLRTTEDHRRDHVRLELVNGQVRTQRALLGGHLQSE